MDEATYEQTAVWRRYPWRYFALAEFVIHTQDIVRPLGIAHEPDPRQVTVVADVFSRQRASTTPFLMRLPKCRYEATDTTWSSGDGPLVRGPLLSIVLVIAGRAAALADLEGDGVGPLRAALPSGPS